MTLDTAFMLSTTLCYLIKDDLYVNLHSLLTVGCVLHIIIVRARVHNIHHANHTMPDQTRPDMLRPDQARHDTPNIPDQTCQTRPGHTISHHTKDVWAYVYVCVIVN